MSPEYAMEGVFSIKSDVYSFGVLMLEILSGRKNNSFFKTEHLFNLVGYVCQTTMSLDDSMIFNACISDHV